MKFIKNVYHFLGGITFVLILIGFTALFVVLGTFIESLTQSHLHASYFTYSNPLFKGLLLLFFINILVSALRRYPFKLKHVPFLITHLGLLMILAGCIFKSYQGIQGTMTLLEGSETNTLFLPSTYALRIENEQHESFVAPLEQNLLGSFKKVIKSPIDNLKIELLEFYPHSQSKLNYWVKNNYLTIATLPKIPLQGKNTRPLKINFNGPTNLFAFSCINSYERAKELYTELASLQMQDEKIVPLKELLSSFHFDESCAKLELLIDGKIIPIQLTGNQLLTNRENITITLPKTLLFTQDHNGNEHFFLFNNHGAIHHELFNKENIHSLLSFKKGFWGYGIAFSTPPHFDKLSREEIEKAHSYYPLFLELQADSDDEEELITFISQTIKPLEPLSKWEDNRAKITLKVSDDHQSSLIGLIYDPFASDLKWPVLNGKYLLRFQPCTKKIPHRLRLRSARQINYPRTQQPYSFECDLLISEQGLKTPLEKTISMNNVHETHDGYRFYMSNLSADELSAKRTQLAVNYDPQKYYLTYPGAFLLSLGILLLFWLRPYKSK
ncbi:MAG: hypothetical protein P4L16_04520 [Chlamydiales bacterium]|nr:hypothetical protein [Chlamydiales bacterium]